MPRMADASGETTIAATLRKRAENWRNVFNVKTGFVQPKSADGSFREPFDPARAGAESGFTEGNSWQYSWYQPQDEAGLIGVLGGGQRVGVELGSGFVSDGGSQPYAGVLCLSRGLWADISCNTPGYCCA